MCCSRRVRGDVVGVGFGSSGGCGWGVVVVGGVVLVVVGVVVGSLVGVILVVVVVGSVALVVVEVVGDVGGGGSRSRRRVNRFLARRRSRAKRCSRCWRGVVVGGVVSVVAGVGSRGGSG